MAKAVIFPGQGAQYIGMGKALYEKFPLAKEIFSIVDRVSGMNITEICFQGPEQELLRTEIQQLAILAVSLAAFEIFKAEKTLAGIRYLSGLSLGEYSCLYAAGVLTLEQTVYLIRERGRAMEKAAARSRACMLALVGPAEEILSSGKDMGFYVANINSPRQVVVSLEKDKKDFVRGEMEKKGIRVVELEVNGGFHSPFMAPAREHLAGTISGLEFRDAEIPVVSNVTAAGHVSAAEIKDNLLKQLVSPVLWKGCVEYMVKEEVDTFFEIGPSKVLKGLIRKICPGVKVVNIQEPDDFLNCE